MTDFFENRHSEFISESKILIIKPCEKLEQVQLDEIRLFTQPRESEKNLDLRYKPAIPRRPRELIPQ